MGELVKFLIETLKASKAASALLVALAVIAVSYAVLLHLRTTPGAAELVLSPLFIAICVVCLAAWLLTLVWTAILLSRRERQLISILICVVAGTSIAVTAVDFNQTFDADLWFDETVPLDAHSLNAFATRLRTTHFRVTVRDRPIVASQDRIYIQLEDVERALKDEISKRPHSPHSIAILVTGKILRSDQWSNLLYTTTTSVGVISVHDVGVSTATTDLAVSRYLLVTTPLVVMRGAALSKDLSLLPKAPPDAMRGCLLDFHRARSTFVQQIRRPVLCPEEAEAIRKAFGSSVLKEYQEIIAVQPGEELPDSPPPTQSTCAYAGRIYRQGEWVNGQICEPGGYFKLSPLRTQ